MYNLKIFTKVYINFNVNLSLLQVWKVIWRMTSMYYQLLSLLISPLLIDSFNLPSWSGNFLTPSHYHFWLIQRGEFQFFSFWSTRPIHVTASASHYFHTWCLSVPPPLFQIWKTKQIPRNNINFINFYWRNCGSGRVDHLHTCLVSFIPSRVGP